MGVSLELFRKASLVDVGIVEQAPKMEGRQMGMLLGPKKKK